MDSSRDRGSRAVVAILRLPPRLHRIPPTVNLSEFEYDLPPELIAQFPAQKREAARLLVHGIDGNETRFTQVSEIGTWLLPGDLLVVNDTKVMPARLHGRRASGGAVEFLFTEPSTNGTWRAMVKPAKKLKADELVEVAGGALRVRMIERVLDQEGRPGALWTIALEHDDAANAVESLLEAHGELPLPPYIERAPADARGSQDLERYQTVYAQHNGAVAAPTAGLHFTQDLLEELAARGVERAAVTLHVGLGTFLPVTVSNMSSPQSIL